MFCNDGQQSKVLLMMDLNEGDCVHTGCFFMNALDIPACEYMLCALVVFV